MRQCYFAKKVEVNNTGETCEHPRILIRSWCFERLYLSLGLNRLRLILANSLFTFFCSAGSNITTFWQIIIIGQLCDIIWQSWHQPWTHDITEKLRDQLFTPGPYHLGSLVEKHFSAAVDNNICKFKITKTNKKRQHEIKTERNVKL